MAAAPAPGSASAADEVVRFSVEGRVARLVLNRPSKLNALNDEVRLGLAAALSSLEERPDVSVLVISGAGRCFSAGADLLSTSYPAVAGSWAAQRHATGTWQRLLDQLGRVPQVTIARLHSHVVGGAVLLAAACDLRIASSDTVVRIPELAIGIPLTWAGVPLLVREVGLPVARDWVMTCRAVSADELLRTGYATRVVPSASLDAAVEECVASLVDLPPGPLSMTRSMFASIGRSTPAMAAGWGDADHMRWSMTEDEYREAARRYLQGMSG
jgi:enoyl-CoA hydratase/carnithine racemase